ncbi:hypothetical protein Bca52824_033980 [Brassica carinata]|uniref:Uncharacterized protein n=1 Tax=Brassica carinata TaxID=52824 RepID=A0A8X7SDV3_BRACI|nr:hypothetical protein Bca52824_033980 [Brassica carinata]
MTHPYEEMKDMKKHKEHYDMLGYICDAQDGIPTRCPCGGEIKTDVSPNPKYRYDFDTSPGSRYFTCKNYELLASLAVSLQFVLVPVYSFDPSPPSTPAPLPTPSFEATPSGSSFDSDPSEDSHDDIPLQMPMPISPDPYYTDIEVDAAHAADHHASHAAAAEDIPHLLASLAVSLQFVLVPVYSFGSFQLVRDQFQAFLNFGFKSYFKEDGMHFRQPWAFGVEDEVRRLRREVDDMAEEIAKLKRLITSTSRP